VVEERALASVTKPRNVTTVLAPGIVIGTEPSVVTIRAGTRGGAAYIPLCYRDVVMTQYALLLRCRSEV
jgi:hypothetical protein